MQRLTSNEDEIFLLDEDEDDEIESKKQSNSSKMDYYSFNVKFSKDLVNHMSIDETDLLGFLANWLDENDMDEEDFKNNLSVETTELLMKYAALINIVKIRQ